MEFKKLPNLILRNTVRGLAVAMIHYFRFLRSEGVSLRPDFLQDLYSLNSTCPVVPYATEQYCYLKRLFLSDFIIALLYAMTLSYCWKR